MHAPQRHAGQSAPSPWVTRFAPLVPAGEVLDLACGSGRHARFFAARGHVVLAVDRDAGALAQLAAHADAGLTTFHHDLENPGGGAAGGATTGTCGNAPSWPFAPGRFSAIVVTNYLHRPLMASMVASLAPGGILLYETFACGNERFGKPSNPDFLLLPGELLQLAAIPGHSLRVVAFEDGYVDLPAPAMVQRLCAMRPADDGAGAAPFQPRL